MRMEPSAEMRSFAATLWQMYNALVQEGFSEEQALKIIGCTLAAATGGGTAP